MPQTPMKLRTWLVVLFFLAGIGLSPAPALADVTAALVTLSPSTAGAAAQVTVTFTTGPAGALVTGVGVINITFPPGHTLPAAISRAHASVNGAVIPTTMPDPTISG